MTANGQGFILWKDQTWSLSRQLWFKYRSHSAMSDLLGLVAGEEASQVPGGNAIEISNLFGNDSDSDFDGGLGHLLPSDDVHDSNAPCALGVDVRQPQAVAPGNVSNASDSNDPFPFQGISMRGRVGSGRHGDRDQRQLLGLHMRSQKQARKQQKVLSGMLKTLKGSTFRKGGKTFRVDAKQKRGGLCITLERQGQKGNRYVRRIPFGSFLEAAYSKRASSSNVALAAKLDVDPSTIPKLQKTCAAEAMRFQIRMLALLLQFCQENPPLSSMKNLG